MSELFGPLQHVALVATLWLIPAGPLLASVAALACALAVRGAEHREARRAAIERAALLIATAGAALAFVASAVHAGMLAARPPLERYLAMHLFRMVRIGQLDTSFDLALDPLAASLCVAVAFVATAACLGVATTTARPATFAARPALLAWMSLLAGAMLVFVLAGDVLVMLIAGQGVAVAVWGASVHGAAGGGDLRAASRRLVAHVAGDAALVLGACLIFWGMGGVFAPEGYVPALEPRFAAVAIAPPDAQEAESASRGDASATTGTGYLTLTSYPGAEVYVDGSLVPLADEQGRTLLAPFARAAVARGAHTFRVHPGGGLDDFLVPHVAVGAGREIALAIFGPTTSFRLLRDQLVVRDARGVSPSRERLRETRVGDLELATIACLVFAAAALAKSLPGARVAGPAAALVQGVAGIGGVYLVARLGFLFAEAKTAGVVLALAGAAWAVASVAASTFERDARAVLARLSTSQVGVMLLGAGMGAYGAAVAHAIVHAITITCLVVSASLAAAARAELLEGDAAHDLPALGGAPVPTDFGRAYVVGCAALAAAPLPGLGAFWSRDELLARVALAGAVRPVVAGALVAVGLLVAAVTSFALFRSYFLGYAPTGRAVVPSAEPAKPAASALLHALALAAAAIGPVVAVARGSLAGERGADGLRWGVSALALGASLAAWKVARDRYGFTRTPDWREREERGLAYRFARALPEPGTLVDALVVRPVQQLSLVARDLDRWVLDGVTSGLGGLVRAVAWVHARADEGVVDAAFVGVGERAAAVGDALRRGQGAQRRRFVARFFATAFAFWLLYYTFLKR